MIILHSTLTTITIDIYNYDRFAVWSSLSSKKTMYNRSEIKEKIEELKSEGFDISGHHQVCDEDKKFFGLK